MTILKKAAVGIAMLLGSGFAAAECGNVQIAEWNWASGELMANCLLYTLTLPTILLV